MKRLIALGLTTVFCIGFLAGLYTPAVSAIGPHGPDQGDYVFTPESGNPPDAYFVVSDTTDVKITGTYFKLYFTNNNAHTITLEHGDLCTQGGFDLYGGSGNNTTFRLYRGDVTGTGEVPGGGLGTTYGVVNGGTCGSRVLTVPAGSLVQSPFNDYFVAFVRADITGPGTQNIFKVKTTDGIVGFQGGVQPQNFGLEISGEDGRLGTFYNKFGPDCRVTGPTWSQLRWYDTDPGSSHQPQQLIFRVLERQRANPSIARWLKLGDFRNANGATIVNPPDPNGPGGAHWRFSEGQSSAGSIEIIVRPDHIYEWVISPVNDGNTLQFALPYDSIYYEQECREAGDDRFNLFPRIDASPTPFAAIGETVRFDFRIEDQRDQDEGETTYRLDVESAGGSLIGGEESQTVTVQPGENKLIRTFEREVAGAWGPRICAKLRIEPVNHQDDPPFRDAEKCIFIGKKPITTIIGGDAWAGGNFENAAGECRVDDGVIPRLEGVSKSVNVGTWGEYGLFSLGSVSIFGSAAQVLFDSAGERLTYSNTGGSGDLGYFFGKPFDPNRDYCFTDIFADYNDNTPAVDEEVITQDDFREDGVLVKERVIKTSSQDVEVNLGSVGRDRTWVIYATANNADVTISGNITYPNGGDDTYGRISNLSRVLILTNGSIKIAPNVERIDASLIARDTINTCSASEAALTIRLCNKELVINAPVASKQLKLRRTYGADGDTPEQRRRPAEIFNLREDYYLSVLGDAKDNSLPVTVEQRELPARY